MRYGIRLLLKKPGFTFVAVLTLALGIGANTAIFSAANALFLRPLPVNDSDRLVRLYATDGEGRSFDVFSYPNYADLRDRNQVFSNLAAHQHVSASLKAGQEAENLEGELVTGNYFAMMETSAMLGRTLLPDDDRTLGAHPVIVISHNLWQKYFGGDAGVVGKTLRLNGHAFTVVGVMPQKFKGSFEVFTADFWAPMMMHEQVRPRGVKLDRRGWGWLTASGRMKPDVTIEQAQADVGRIAAQLRQDYPDVNRGIGFEIFPASVMPEQFNEDVSKALGFIMIIAGLVLLVACANIASMLLARVMMRGREIAIRQSLGASRIRLARQWLTESVLLSLMGGAAGLLVAVWVKDGLVALAPPDWTNFAPEPRLDASVLVFALCVAVLTGAVFGLVPALRASRTDVGSALKEEGAIGSSHRSRSFSLFVIAQVTVSLVLLVVAGLLLRSLRESEAFNPGFNSDNILLAKIDLNRNGYEEDQGKEFYRQLTERLRVLPGVTSVSSANWVPLGGERETMGYRIEGHLPPPGRTTFSLDTALVGPDYFSTMGIPILRGRGFDDREAKPGASPAVVVNETMASRFWPGEDAVGKRFQLAGGPSVEIIGIARNIKYHSLGEEPRPFVYGSSYQVYFSGMTLHMRTAGDPMVMARAVKKEVAAIDANVAILNMTTLSELRGLPLFPVRALATISTMFGALALLLTAVGIYGMVSYSVSRRTREIGIRMALGADRNGIFRLIIGQGLTLTLIGIVVGLGACFALTRFLSSLLFGISATDPLTFVGTALLLIVAALAACYIPARRAIKVDPMTTLRYE